MFKNDLDRLNYFGNIIALIVVALSVFAIIIAAVQIFSDKEKITKHNIVINYQIVADTSSNYFEKSANSYYLRAFEDKNKKIYDTLNVLIESFEKRNSEILNQSNKQSDFVSYSSAIFALIISIAGFFGFKSIIDLKKASIDAATEEAKKTFRDIESEYDKKIADKITLSLKDGPIDLEKKFSNLEELISDCCDQINTHGTGHNSDRAKRRKKAKEDIRIKIPTKSKQLFTDDML